MYHRPVSYTHLLGAQIIGYEGVDKRIDVLATAIHAGLKATQLKDLDLSLIHIL